MGKNPIFDKAVALRDEGKFSSEGADLFLDLAKSADDLFEKASMLLNATHATKGAVSVSLARNQLNVSANYSPFRQMLFWEAQMRRLAACF